jgi:apolipoprotein N-acyltransferase
MSNSGRKISLGTAVLIGTAALVGTAVLCYFGTGLTPIAALTWLAPLPVLLAAPRLSGWATAGIAFAGYFLGTANSWSFFAHSHDEPMTLGILVSACFSLTFTLYAWLFRRLLEKGRPLLAALAAPASWTGVLYVVSVTSPAGLMGNLASTQADVPLLLQSSSVTGMWGLEFLVLLVPATVAAICAPGVRTAARVRTGTVTAVVLALVLGAGALRLADENGPTQRVAAVAHNTGGWAPAVSTPAGRALVADYAARIAALPDGVRTAVLPEGAFGVGANDTAAVVDPLGQVARARGIDIVAGVFQQIGGTRYNFGLTIPANGAVPVAYLKQHDTASKPGHDLIFPPVNGFRTGIEVCGDVNFPNPSRDYGRAGARMLAVPASDEDDNGWLGSRTALLRGAENGQSIVWAARQGVPMIADGRGRVLADAHTGGPGEFTTVVADVPAGPGETPYSRFGDWFGWLCLVLTLGGLVAAFSRNAKFAVLVREGVTPES